MKIESSNELLVEMAAFTASILNINRFSLKISEHTDALEASECVVHTDGTFEIIVETEVHRDCLINHIAHEMTHLRQYKHDQLVTKNEILYWNGVPQITPEFMTDEYFLVPWEMEARAMEGFIKYRWENRE